MTTRSRKKAGKGQEPFSVLPANQDEREREREERDRNRKEKCLRKMGPIGSQLKCSGVLGWLSILVRNKVKSPTAQTAQSRNG